MHGHNRRLVMDDRFWHRALWSHVETAGPDACWPWNGRGNNSGYGLLTSRVAKRVNGSSALAHRAAYMVSVGPVPDGLWVLHHCDNPPCCNPAHLYAGTASDNSLDCHGRGRWHNDPERGVDRWSCKLTEDNVREVRLLLAAGGKKSAIARRFGVSDMAIRHIVSGRNWKHVH